MTKAIKLYNKINYNAKATYNDKREYGETNPFLSQTGAFEENDICHSKSMLC